jgi:hypothetical protein
MWSIWSLLVVVVAVEMVAVAVLVDYLLAFLVLLLVHRFG